MITNGILVFSLLFSAANANAQGVEKGNFMFDLYYGAPNIGKSVAKSFTADANNYKSNNARGIGPAGVRFEYMLSDNFGLGVDFIYNSAAFDLKYDSLKQDQTLYKTYTATAKMERVRIHLRFNYHIEMTEDLDVYLGLGAGTNSRVWSIDSNEPGYEFRNTKMGTLLPVSMRFAVGLRYYFTPNIGINTEIGLGGPLVSAGLSIKI